MSDTDKKIDVLTDLVKEVVLEQRKFGVLQESVQDDISKIVDALSAQGEIIQTLATKDDIAELKTEIKTIKLAVKATNQDLTETKRVFGRLKTT